MRVAHFLKINYVCFFLWGIWFLTDYILPLKFFWLNISDLKETSCICLLRLSLKYFQSERSEWQTFFLFSVLGLEVKARDLIGFTSAWELPF